MHGAPPNSRGYTPASSSDAPDLRRSPRKLFEGSHRSADGVRLRRDQETGWGGSVFGFKITVFFDRYGGFADLAYLPCEGEKMLEVWEFEVGTG